MAAIPAKKMLAHATHGMSHAKIDNITIFYHDASEREFACNGLDHLRSADPLGYVSVNRHVNTIAILGARPNWNRGKSAGLIGLTLGTYFDELTPTERSAIDAKRYGCILLRFAILARLLDEFDVRVTRFGGRDLNRRIWRIVNNRDLKCCERLGCEQKHIYEIGRWMRR